MGAAQHESWLYLCVLVFGQRPSRQSFILCQSGLGLSNLWLNFRIYCFLGCSDSYGASTECGAGSRCLPTNTNAARTILQFERLLAPTYPEVSATFFDSEKWQRAQRTDPQCTSQWQSLTNPHMSLHLHTRTPSFAPPWPTSPLCCDMDPLWCQISSCVLFDTSSLCLACSDSN